MSDPFEDFAEEHQSSYSKRREQKAANRAVEKALAERNKLFELWKKAHEKRKKELLAGPHSEIASELMDFLEHMTLDSADELLTLVEPWRGLDADAKFMALSLIDSAIVYMREAEGLPPFDDPIDGELNVFLTIKEMLR